MRPRYSSRGQEGSDVALDAVSQAPRVFWAATDAMLSARTATGEATTPARPPQLTPHPPTGMQLGADLNKTWKVSTLMKQNGMERAWYMRGRGGRRQGGRTPPRPG